MSEESSNREKENQQILERLAEVHHGEVGEADPAAPGLFRQEVRLTTTHIRTGLWWRELQGRLVKEKNRVVEEPRKRRQPVIGGEMF